MPEGISRFESNNLAFKCLKCLRPAVTARIGVRALKVHLNGLTFVRYPCVISSGWPRLLQPRCTFMLPLSACRACGNPSDISPDLYVSRQFPPQIISTNFPSIFLTSYYSESKDRACHQCCAACKISPLGGCNSGQYILEKKKKDWTCSDFWGNVHVHILANTWRGMNQKQRKPSTLITQTCWFG